MTSLPLTASPVPPFANATTDRGGLALALPGGGARGAYQVGVLQGLAQLFPELHASVLTGVSAGAINAAALANHHGSLRQATDELAGLWSELMPERIFRVDSKALAANLGRWALRLGGGGATDGRARGLVDTQPLADFLREAMAPVDGVLQGVGPNLARGRLNALAIGTTNYTTGQSVVFVQGREIESWDTAERRAVHTDITVDHVMASAALPMFFPAVPIGDHWYGDGGIRLTAPLAPALHLGAHKILAVSNRHRPSEAEASRPAVAGYPPPAQVLGVLYNAVFLDVVDQDAARMERMSALLRRLPDEHRAGMRPVELMVMRPSRDLTAIAGEYEPRLPRGFRLLTRGLGTRETSTPDVLSLVMFQDDYIKRLISIGQQDVERRAEEIARFLASERAAGAS